jgi:hypothetical protein
MAKLGSISGHQVHGKQAQALAKFGIAHFGTPGVPIFPIILIS